MRYLWVGEPMRRRGIGAALVAAARKAAHTRGARTFYAQSTGDLLSQFGFVAVPQEEVLDSLMTMLSAGETKVRTEAPNAAQIWKLDLSRDGIIER